MNRNQRGQIKIVGIVVVALVVGSMYAPQISQFITGIIGGDANPFNPVTVTGDTSPHKFTLSKRGTSTAVESATAYAWYDWNSNGMVDLGAYPDGEIEELTSAATTGLVTTTVEYPIGEPVLYQIHKAGYEVETFSRIRTSLPSAYDGSALVVPTCYLTLTDTHTSLVRVAGVGYLVTESTDYNWSLNGAEPTFIFEATSVSTDAGLNEKAYTHWSTGDIYHGTVVAATFTNQDWIDLGVTGWDGFFAGATTTTCWFNTAGYFNDASDTGDEVFELDFELSILADGDIATIGLYNGMELKNLIVGSLNTPIATHETNIDIDDGI